MVTTVSEKGVVFTGILEGDVLHAYRDSGGVVTIGRGATNRSRVARAWFHSKWGRDLRMGDTITAAESDMLLRKLMNEEYGPYVIDRMGPDLPQHQFDQTGSTTYNCGPGTLGDRWARALRDGDITGAAELLKTTRVTANGKPLRGLRVRRKEEAELMKDGDYQIGGSGAPSNISTEKADVMLYQRQLKVLNYYTGKIDGIAGELTIGAVKNFQRANGLEVDGLVGRATRSTLQRAMDVHNQNLTTAGGGVVGAGGSTAVDTVPIGDQPAAVEVVAATDIMQWALIGVGAAVVILILWLIWRYRGRIVQSAERVVPSVGKWFPQQRLA